MWSATLRALPDTMSVQVRSDIKSKFTIFRRLTEVWNIDLNATVACIWLALHVTGLICGR